MDYNKNHGFWVRVRRNGIVHSKWFSDLKCGGYEHAETMAKEYNDELLSTLPAIKKDRESPNRNNNYGVHRIYLSNNMVMTYWDVDGGSRITAGFSVRMYGSKALTLAVLSQRSKMRVSKATPDEHEQVQNEYGSCFPDLDIIKQQISRRKHACEKNLN